MRTISNKRTNEAIKIIYNIALANSKTSIYPYLNVVVNDFYELSHWLTLMTCQPFEGLKMEKGRMNVQKETNYTRVTRQRRRVVYRVFHSDFQWRIYYSSEKNHVNDTVAFSCHVIVKFVNMAVLF